MEVAPRRVSIKVARSAGSDGTDPARRYARKPSSVSTVASILACDVLPSTMQLLSASENAWNANGASTTVALGLVSWVVSRDQDEKVSQVEITQREE